MAAISEPTAGFPFKESRAAIMLKNGLDRAHKERELSIRSIGKMLGYKQATVLSHMASGRVPVPLERATQIAEVIGIDPVAFLIACIEQRVTNASDLLMSHMEDDAHNFGLTTELELISGSKLNDLTDEQKTILRKVAADPRPSRRWLTEAELPLVESIRRLRPNFASDGLGAADWARIERVLIEHNAC